ncbi:hypothetical protein V8C44DRAFT_334777 [Trichoderma aethiopicum]
MRYYVRHLLALLSTTEWSKMASCKPSMIMLTRPSTYTYEHAEHLASPGNRALNSCDKKKARNLSNNVGSCVERRD